MTDKKQFGIYGTCEVCGQPIYEHMEENKRLFDEYGMCGSCITGESAVYLDEVGGETFAEHLEGIKND